MSILVLNRRVESKKLTEKANNAHAANDDDKFENYGTSNTVLDEQHFLHIVLFSVLFILN